MPKTLKSSNKTRHDPLHVQLEQDETLANFGKASNVGKRAKRKRADGEEQDGEIILDAKESQRIFDLAKDQQDELDQEDEVAIDPSESIIHHQTREPAEDDEEEDDEEMEFDVRDAEEMLQIDSNDLETMDAMLPQNTVERRTLADIIFAKLESESAGDVKSTRKKSQDAGHPDPAMGLDPRVVEAYTKVGTLLRTYRSGPLPKPFKVIPTLAAWARLLALTSPENWSPHSCRAATRLFIPTMKPQQAQVFLQAVLLDAVREDIRSNRKLNVHYYEALKRSLYKPSAFFKGIVFPMLETGCNLREAAIIASILSKIKIPVLHSSAALLHIANMDYTGPNSLFIRVLIDKKYELPYKVVDALVFHFIRLSNTYKARNRGDTNHLPVLWHQSLLAFCQRYACDLTQDQKDALLDVARANPHAQLSPEVRRELINSVARGELGPDEQDVVMS